MENIWIFSLIVILFIVSVVLMRLILPPLIKKLKEKGKIGIDVHKLDKPEVAEMGGVSILIVACVTALIPLIIYDNFFVKIQLLVFIAIIGLVGLVGIVDDLYKLGPKIKPLLVAAASFPLLIANFFWLREIVLSDPSFPIIGKAFNVSVLYWLLIPISLAVAANAVNMIDVVNGSMSGPCIVIFGTLLICSLLRREMNQFSITGAFLSAIMLGIMIIFYKYNRYPARVFSGDVGALTVGSALALIGIMGDLEIVTVVVAFPLVINAFQMLASVRGFVEGRKIKERPSIVRDDGLLEANPDIKAPMTLMRIVLAKGPTKEPEISRNFMGLTIFCAFLAFITFILSDYWYIQL